MRGMAFFAGEDFVLSRFFRKETEEPRVIELFTEAIAQKQEHTPDIAAVLNAVSYTHLDVYKRQGVHRIRGCAGICGKKPAVIRVGSQNSGAGSEYHTDRNRLCRAGGQPVFILYPALHTGGRISEPDRGSDRCLCSRICRTLAVCVGRDKPERRGRLFRIHTVCLPEIWHFHPASCGRAGNIR